MIVATAGHVDHGKTSLVRQLTGVDTDRLPEEKRRGMSIDLGFAYLSLPGAGVLGFVDVPGHERFIANMLAGVASIGCALLVVAADDGPRPQTAEHLAILDLLGIPTGVIVLTKMDRVDSNRIATVRGEIRELTRGSFLEHAPIFEVASTTGAGVGALKEHLCELAGRAVEPDSSGNFRLSIDRGFTLPGVGLVVTGAALSGSVARGDALVLAPAGIDVHVRSLHAQNRAAESGRAGQRLALNLTGARLERQHIQRGDWLVAPAASRPTSRLDAWIRVRAGEAQLLKHLSPVHVHLGAADVTGRIALLGGRGVGPGECSLGQIVLSRPVIAVHGDCCVIRDQSARRTIAGAEVLDPFAPARGMARDQRIERLSALRTGSNLQKLRKLLQLAQGGLDLGWFARAMNLSAQEGSALLAQADCILIGRPPVQLGMERSHWHALGSRIMEVVRAWEEEFPERLGISASHIGRALVPAVAPSVLSAALSTLVTRGSLQQGAQLFSRPGHKAGLAPDEAALWKRVRAALESGGVHPMPVYELAQSLRVDARRLIALLERAAKLGLAVQISLNRYFLPEIVHGLARVAEELAATHANGCFEPAEYRDRSGTGRRLSVELLEYFDKVGLTRRLKEGRKIMRPAAEVFDAPRSGQSFGRATSPGGTPGLQIR